MQVMQVFLSPLLLKWGVLRGKKGDTSLPECFIIRLQLILHSHLFYIFWPLISRLSLTQFNSECLSCDISTELLPLLFFTCLDAIVVWKTWPTEVYHRVCNTTGKLLLALSFWSIIALRCSLIEKVCAPLSRYQSFHDQENLSNVKRNGPACPFSDAVWIMKGLLPVYRLSL